jgi:hypothetical protein
VPDPGLDLLHVGLGALPLLAVVADLVDDDDPERGQRDHRQR